VKIVLVQNFLLDGDAAIDPGVLYPHLGLISLVSVVERAGHDATLYDPMLALWKGELRLDASLYREMAAAILRQSPDVVGLTALGCNFIAVVKVASYLKAIAPELPILLGGPHASVLHRAIMERFTQFDVLVRNEAEFALPKVLAALHNRALDLVPGISFRRDGKVCATEGAPIISDLDALPFPAYDRYPIRELGLRMMRVEAGRGCPFECTFCSTATFFGRQYRLKSPGRLCGELDFLRDRYGITDFALQHDLFTVNKTKVRAFCEEVRDRGYTWTCSARADCVDNQLLDQMKLAGCRAIYYGIEAGSRRMQKVIKKHLDLSLVLPILDKTHSLGIEATLSFITGYPQEEQADQDETLDFIGVCMERDRAPLNVQLHLLTPEPGTQLLEDFRKDLDYDGHISDFNFPPVEDDDPAIMKANAEVFMNHHYFRSVTAREKHIFTSRVYYQLYPLGATVLTHLTALYDGKFSALIASMFEFWKQSRDLPNVDAEFVCSFLEREWGSQSYLLSLARYMYAGAGLLKSNAAGPPTERALHGGSGHIYVLSPGALVLRDVHNCPAILAELREGGHSSGTRRLIPKRLLSQRSHYLLYLDGDRVLRTFALDDLSVAFVDYFSHPRTQREMSSVAHSELSRGFISKLIESGVVRSSSPVLADLNDPNSRLV
jgi:radical SAM superfamily enzyme YgiQ (UPF0313 family)